jgi:hypothetical protein
VAIDHLQLRPLALIHILIREFDSVLEELPLGLVVCDIPLARVESEE